MVFYSGSSRRGGCGSGLLFPLGVVLALFLVLRLVGVRSTFSSLILSLVLTVVLNVGLNALMNRRSRRSREPRRDIDDQRGTDIRFRD
ncbi:hypothetical protein M3A96_09710 [Helcobacillus massiliensis]|uniref:hypothetical protein n=1 Tax=Helcobacillus massiliensis TaxID=521392 RepID=UPI0021A87917|nr:hypothetical protein [Helcobacillus massiliensis]MCT1558388.1 hypothetical protein [Helcobacillus massiliensis]MCT2036840.1 hypothetical protein [Helcobacillus massiliensis]MCT2332621.1 hypothetical protein [Helcobacillus massiliensis]